MPIYLRDTVRPGVVLLVTLVLTSLLGWHWQFGIFAVVGPAPIIAALSAVWAHFDVRRDAAATEWIWTRAATWMVAGVVVVALLHGWPVWGSALLALAAGAAVAVPAWVTVAGVRRASCTVNTAERPVPPIAMTLVTVGGVAAFLAAPVALAAWAAMIAWSGCFLECREPDRVAAVGSAAVAAVLLLDVVIWGVAARRRFPRSLTRLAAVPLAVCALAPYAMR